MGRIAETFIRLKKEGKTGLIPFLTVGYPDAEATLEMALALVAGGADVVELGIPFSDPLADGPTIQRASFHALSQGVTTDVCLETAEGLRRKGVSAPLVFMGYYNPILAYGLERFVKAASSAGVDGLIVADLPVEEAAQLRAACLAYGLNLIAMLAPTSTEERIARTVKDASGFVYCVSIAGITGARDDLPPGLGEMIRRVRKHTALPIAVGFGISKREHVAAVGKEADAAVIGSAIIDLIDRTDPKERILRLKEYLEVVTGHGR